jgi:hypothetical protein
MLHSFVHLVMTASASSGFLPLTDEIRMMRSERIGNHPYVNRSVRIRTLLALNCGLASAIFAFPIREDTDPHLVPNSRFTWA